MVSHDAWTGACCYKAARWRLPCSFSRTKWKAYLCYQSLESRPHYWIDRLTLWVFFFFHKMYARSVEESSTLFRCTCGRFARRLQSQKPTRVESLPHITHFVVCAERTLIIVLGVYSKGEQEKEMWAEATASGAKSLKRRKKKKKERMETSSWDLLQINEIIRYNSPAAVTILLYF